MKLIEASLLAFSKNKFKMFFQLLKMRIKKIKQIHYDVMDGIFVCNTAFYKQHLKLIKFLGFKLSIHLMVQDPMTYVEFYKKIKPDYLTFHVEAIDHAKTLEIIEYIKKTSNIKSGIAIKPNTDLDCIMDLIFASDIINVMSVEPGAGGQQFIEDAVARIQYIRDQNYHNLIEVDGGINIENIKKLVNNVDFFVSGTFLVNYKSSFKNLYCLLQQGNK